MTQMDVAPYRAFWRKLAEARPTPEMRVAMDAARKEAERLAQILASEFGVKRVYLFGSFAWGAVVRPESDIDLAVEGLPPGKILDAYGRMEESSRYAVDLEKLDSLPPLLHDLVLKSGIVVYERKSKKTVDHRSSRRNRKTETVTSRSCRKPRRVRRA